MYSIYYIPTAHSLLTLHSREYSLAVLLWVNNHALLQLVSVLFFNLYYAPTLIANLLAY